MVSSDPSLGDTTIHAGDRPAPTPDRLGRGQTLGRYLIIDRIGAGGMGQVYSAFDPELDRKVAIKLLHVAAGPSRSDDDAARLIREAQAMARVSHPNVITVHDVGRWGDSVFVAMEFLTGGTLGDWLEQPHEWPEIVEVFAAAGRGLVAAHAAGLVHRDFKPENVLLGEAGRVAVADFGLARLATADEEEAEDEDEVVSETLSSSVGSLSVQLTRTGALLGTPAYMSPEQHLKAEVDARTDQFSFCIALYEALYDARPYRGETLAALAFQVVQGKLVEPPARSGVPNHLRRLVLRGLSRRKSDRYPSMDALVEDLVRDPRQSRSTWWLLGGAVALVAGTVALSGGGEEVAKTCDGGETELAQVWNDESRASLRAAFEGTDRSWAAPSAERVEATLTRYADEWMQMHRDACEATHKAGTQSDRLLDLRMMCLRERRSELASLVELLGTGDLDVLRNAISVSDGLASIEACADVEALTARVPPPDDPQVREEVEGLTAELSRARVLWRAGKDEEARQVGENVLERARELEYAPLMGDSNILIAQAIGSADRAASVRHLDQAVDLAMRGGDDLRVAYAASVLVRTLRSTKERDRESEIDLWVRIAKGSLARAGGENVSTYSGLMLNYGQALVRRGDLDAAQAAFEEALELRREAMGDEDPRVADAWRGMGMVAYHRGELDQVAEYNQRALGIYEGHYGTDHPRLTSTRSNIAVVQLARGQHELALEQLERVLAIRTERYGPDHEDTASAMANVAIARMGLGQYAQAEELLRKSLAIVEKVPETPVVDIGESISNLAMAVSLQGRHAEAAEMFQRALELFREQEGPRSIRVGRATSSLGRELREDGRLDEAERLADLAIEILTEQLGADNTYTLNAMIQRAYVDVAKGKARAAVERIEAKAKALGDSDNGELRVRAELLLADAQAALHDRDASHAHARRGLELMKELELQERELERRLRARAD